MSDNFYQDPGMERIAWLAACEQDGVFELLCDVVRAGSTTQFLVDMDSKGLAFVELAGAISPDEADALEADHANRLELAQVIFGDEDQETAADTDMDLVSSVMERASREYDHYRRAQLFCEREGITLEEFQERYGPLRVFQILYGDPAHPDLVHRALEAAVEEGRYEPIPDDFRDTDNDS